MPQEGNATRIAFDLEELTRVAIQKVNEFDELSNLPPNTGSAVPLDWTNLHVGSLLGTGTFAAVYEVKLENAEQQNGDDENDETLALKVLRPDVVAKENKGECLAGAVDLAIEARILASLQHENIIRMRGVNSGSFEDSLEACDGFLVLDYLVQTLDQFLTHERLRLEQVRAQSKWHTMSDKINFSKRSGRRLLGDSEAMHQRIQTIALGIAQAMEYLHSHGLIFRDLKPSNVGFDATGQVKIFDLGLARPLHCLEMGRPVGSPRYMAPEIARCEPYGLPADVYTFGIVLHEICSLQKPFSNMVVSSQIRQRVAYGNERPPLNEIGGGHRYLKMLLQACWHSSPRSRPSFSMVLSELKKLEMQEQRRLIGFGSSALTVSREGTDFAEDTTRRRLTFLLPSRRTEGGNVMKQIWRKVTLAPVLREEEELVFSH